MLYARRTARVRHDRGYGRLHVQESGRCRLCGDPRLRRRWRAFLAYEDITGDDDHSDHLHEVVKMAECPAV